MKTPIQELIQSLNIMQLEYNIPIEAIEEAIFYLEKEKQAIKESWWDGFKLQRVVVDSNADEVYFNQKYNNNEGTTLG